MTQTKNSTRFSKEAILVLSVFFLVFLFSGSLFAEGIAQDIGFKDVGFTGINKAICQGCHGDSQVDAHHGTSYATSGDCSHCHKVSTEPGKIGVALERECKACHKKSPHHETQAATDKECNSCHESPGVSDFSTEVPPYSASKVTPTVENCRICHKEGGEVDGLKIVSMKDTHHGISLKGCNTCHDPENKRSTDIRICERCHSAKAIHEVLPHVQKDACGVCHGGKIAPPALTN
ncbi:MAG: hypothetical protein KAW12_17670 [Candidatus Aminicenantes bacterium]|nr:hypothetical protein [Candidatus Aminicenantes bacterium]